MVEIFYNLGYSQIPEKGTNDYGCIQIGFMKHTSILADFVGKGQKFFRHHSRYNIRWLCNES